MKWFLDLGMRSKLLVGFGMMIAFFVTVITVAYLGITAIQTSEKNLYENEFANVQDLMELLASQNGVRAALLNMIVITERSRQETAHQDVKEFSDAVTRLTQGLLGRNRNDSLMFRRSARRTSKRATPRLSR